MLFGEEKVGIIRACVIGCGAAGLVCIRHLAQRSDQFCYDAYEQTDSIGGTWNYTDSVGNDCNGLPLHTSVYRNMRTNLPMEIMEFKDFPSNSDISFVSHTEVLKYLRDYANYFNINQYIKFNHQILSVSRWHQFWKIVIKDLANSSVFEKLYDAVFVCVGKYSSPKFPNFDGMHTFTGSLIHSHDYRVPNCYANQNVLVLGGGPSGIDISIEVSDCATSVVWCHLSKPFINMPKNVTQEMATIKNISRSVIELSNGKIYENIDAIILGTGYRLNFDFLDKNCGISLKNDATVDGLYMHLINTAHPSMTICGILHRILPFPVFDQQALFFIKSLTKEFILPSKTDMDKHNEDDRALRLSLGLSERYGHAMSRELLWKYYDEITSIARLTPIRPVAKMLFNDLLEKLAKLDIAGYKDVNYDILSDHEYVIK